MQSTHTSRAIAAGTALLAAVSLAACGSSGSSGADDKVIEFWDPYPQYAEGSDWDTYVKDCAPEGYTIKRQGLPQNDVLNNLTTAVKADNAPDIAVLDNPFMPTAVDSGLVTDLAEAGVDVDGFDANIEGPGIVDGVHTVWPSDRTRSVCTTIPRFSKRQVSILLPSPIGTR